MPTATTEGRGARRKAETRGRLLAAARELFARQGVDATRIGQISDAADVGAGSFYNHFEGKEDIVEAVMTEATEAQAARVEELTQGVDDPAEVTAIAHRHFVRLARTDPTFGGLVVRLDLSHRLLTTTLAPPALRDLEAGIASGRFHVPDTGVALYAMGGALIGVMRGMLDGRVPPDADVAHAESVLRMLGVGREEAAAIAARPMPELTPAP